MIEKPPEHHANCMPTHSATMSGTMIRKGIEKIITRMRARGAIPAHAREREARRSAW